ncbi:SDR family oxidoreductase [Conexibacter stalactiti]|uniref:SDR family oxidoreductase n=1 Tax=Conexibacter stalactiti TaxID=1940611 RepID=A0ABU4HJT6_9ACTN|nr:SDR family oxidoreductase [Conexibacter stalactiti]MDW5593582.1 SDR family oxidoreductase [Conexibacter stalactiti]MEC5034223.1 SDR family oxidoreductase [Conexibacter stalactiti]
MAQRVSIVTGAASGIGRATALALAAQGDAVLVADLDGAGAERTAAEITAAGGVAVGRAVNVASAEDCEAAVGAAASLGELRALVNVAGIAADPDTVESISDADLERLWSVNVGAVFRLGRHAIPLLRAAGGGAIVTTSSVHAYATMTGNAAYAASKGALVALTRQLALDLAPDGIRSVCVAPGSVDTPLTRRELARRGLSAADAGFDDSGSTTAIGRVARPEEIAAVIAWVAGDAASVVNGTTVVADAGLLARLV